MKFLSQQEIELVQRDVCPECRSGGGFEPGPRAGDGCNVFCRDCGQGFEVTFPRGVIVAHRIETRTR